MLTLRSATRTVLIVLAAATATASPALSDPILGVWRLPNGILIRSTEHSGQFCGTVISGDYRGRSIGCVGGGEGRYRGEVIKVKDGKRYRGHATLAGDVLTVTGCVLFILCRSEKLTRQAQMAAE
jgi:uncharacterized protein (DUF2147 family)